MSFVLSFTTNFFFSPISTPKFEKRLTQIFNHENKHFTTALLAVSYKRLWAKNIAEKVIKNHIVLKDKTKIYINDLLYVKAEDHYIRLFIADNKNHFVRGRLSDLETELPPNFIRIHRSYIINRNYVKSFSGDQIQLINGERIPIGRTYRKKIDH